MNEGGQESKKGEESSSVAQKTLLDTVRVKVTAMTWNIPKMRGKMNKNVTADLPRVWLNFRQSLFKGSWMTNLYIYTATL